MVDVHALNVALWGVIISCAVAIGLAIGIIAWAWLAQRRRQARQAASVIRAAERHLVQAARDHSAR